MKRISSLVLAALLVLALSACSAGAGNAHRAGPRGDARAVPRRK